MRGNWILTKVICLIFLKNSIFDFWQNETFNHAVFRRLRKMKDWICGKCKHEICKFWVIEILKRWKMQTVRLLREPVGAPASSWEPQGDPRSLQELLGVPRSIVQASQRRLGLRRPPTDFQGLLGLGAPGGTHEVAGAPRGSSGCWIFQSFNLSKFQSVVEGLGKTPIRIRHIERLKDWEVERLKDWKIERLRDWKIERLKD